MTYNLDPIPFSLQATRQHLENFIPEVTHPPNLQFRGAYYQATLCIQKYRIVRRLQDKINSFKQKSESVDYQLVGSQSENNNICKNE